MRPLLSFLPDAPDWLSAHGGDDAMSEEKIRNAGVMHVSFELLHSMLRLPDDVRIVFTLSGAYPRAVTFGLAGGDLPELPSGKGMESAVVQARYEGTPENLRFIRFERIDDG